MNNIDVFKKLDRMQDKISDLCVTTAKIEVDLRYHVEGTIQNRAQITAASTRISTLENANRIRRGIYIAIAAVLGVAIPAATYLLRSWLF